MSIVVRTLSERIFEVVRERIVNGALPEELPIRQDALANELGVSKIPLREALVRLVQEGLLVGQANRGYFVHPMSNEQADEIFALRLAVEPSAAAYASSQASEEERAHARLAYQALDSAAHANLANVAMCNRTFHTALVRPGGRLLTIQLVERLAILAERYVIAHLRPEGRDARAHREHRQLFETWTAGDSKQVEQLLKEHLEGTRNDLRKQFKPRASRRT